MSSGEIDAVIEKDIEEKQKNEFEEPKQIDVRGLIKEEDINKKITDHYGDISKGIVLLTQLLIGHLKVLFIISKFPRIKKVKKQGSEKFWLQKYHTQSIHLTVSFL